ncbi:hypothetical protein [Lentzea xinjiangensis]|uniref:hypothetical protein n=1 Tax=Lentzea xinjiangensis TaxID=402600 RepID=UPI001160C8F8|nr:hypothetical protein [Lentzea xinjiangensis]
MRFVVASAHAHRLEEVSRKLNDVLRVEFRLGSIPNAGFDCNAGIVHYTLAHDRYGGRPVVGRAQVLQNLRGDGAPLVILATPPLEDDTGLGLDRNVKVENRVIRMLGMCIDEWVLSGESVGTDSTCLVHMEGSGLDFDESGAVVAGLERIIAQYV